MNDLETIGQQALMSFSSVYEAEKVMLELPQVSCPVVHHFGPNICIREVFMPKDTLAIGHRQKFDHLNIMLRGKVMILNEDGSTQILTAPMIFMGKAGRKIGYVMEDMVWQNVYSTDLKNIDEIEDFFIEKSENWQQDHQAKLGVEKIAQEANRLDYHALLKECGIPHEIAKMQSENESDFRWIDSQIVRVSDSAIEGKGLFVTVPIKAGDLICPARINGYRTQAGKYTNHSMAPNAKMVLLPSGDIDLIATVDLDGCMGGDFGTEVTIDYRQALALSGIHGIKQ